MSGERLSDYGISSVALCCAGGLTIFRWRTERLSWSVRRLLHLRGENKTFPKRQPETQQYRPVHYKTVCTATWLRKGWAKCARINLPTTPN